MRDTCATCRFWVVDRKPFMGVLFGECRAHAPYNLAIKRHRPYAREGYRPVWPFTGEREWCGDYQIKEQPSDDDQ